MADSPKTVVFCLGCLSTERKTFPIISNGLLESYKMLIGSQDYENELEGNLCWECARLVQKFNSFRMKCVTAQTLLKDLRVKHAKITKKNIKSINLKKIGVVSHMLQTEIFNISIIDDGNNDSEEIKTHCVIVEPKDELMDDEIWENDFDNFLNVDEQAERKITDIKDCASPSDNSEKEEDNKLIVKKVSRSKIREKKPKLKKKLSKTKTIKNVKSKLKKDADNNIKTTTDLSEYANVVTLTLEEQIQDVLKRKDSSNYKRASFRCDLCYKGFVHEEAYANHATKHDPISGQHECYVCKSRWKTEKKMSAHISQVHMYRYMCKFCEFSCQHKEQSHSHYKWHMGVKYKCAICEIEFEKKTTYLSHCRSKHPCGEICHICGDSFTTQYGLRQHIGMSHKDTGGILYCADCDKHFTSSQAGRRHLSTKAHMEKVNAGKECTDCGIKFTTAKQFEQHRNEIHNGSQSVEESTQKKEGTFCDVCNVSFVSEAAWTKHILTSYRHVNERDKIKNGCKHCGKLFQDKKGLKEHLRRVRAVEEGPYECDQCGETALSRSKYYAHVAEKHPGKKKELGAETNNQPFPCEQCGQQVSSYREYYAHFRRQHPHKTRTRYPAGRFAVMCDLCGKVFQHKSHLKLHIYKHTGERPFECDVCAKSFNTPHYLEIHKRIHTDERYACKVCGQGFTHYSNLHRHRIVHSDAKPYVCATCGKGFKLRSMLKSHTDYVHMKKPWPKRNRNREAKVQNSEDLN